MFVCLADLPHTLVSFHSGLAVMPNTDDQGAARDRVFGMAQNASSDESGQVRRTITMVSRSILQMFYTKHDSMEC